jgi:hypothetical protein
MPGYMVKAILVNIEDVVAVLGSGNDALGLEILNDKKHKKHFKEIDSKRPFVFVTTKPGVKEQPVKKTPTMEKCVHQLLCIDEDHSSNGSNDDDGVTTGAVVVNDDHDDDQNNNKLDERTGYKYLFALEAIALRCGGKYLYSKHWENFRMGYIGDVQLKAFKRGIDLEINALLERGLPPAILQRKKIPPCMDYPQIGYVRQCELATLVDMLLPQVDDEHELETNGDHYTTEASEEHLAEALAEFEGWIQKSIVQSKDLLFFTYHD